MDPEDFLRPTGRLDPDWIDEDALQALITQAEALTSNQNAQRAFVYAQAYSRLADDFALTPATRAADDVRESFTAAQVNHWARQAASWQVAFDSILGAGTSGVRRVTPTW